MNPFFFGSSSTPIFGIYHCARSSTPLETGIVLCYPFGHEYIRAHRAFRRLAALLAKAGFHVLRFDYFGTGDSAGDSEAGSIAQWINDITAAIDELKDIAQLRAVSLIGLRMGATLAALAGEQRRDVAQIVLWDPVISGKAYVTELLALHHDKLGRSQPSLDGAAQSPRHLEVVGFPVTQQMVADLKRLDLYAVQAYATRQLFLVVSQETAAYARFRDHLSRLDVHSTYRHVPRSGDWDQLDTLATALLPHEILNEILTLLSRTSGR